jgi:lysophospholipase L1-like esterase
VGHAVNNTMFLSYQGEDMTPQDALAACGVNKVFILLGMNDIALYGIDKTIENWGTLIASIRDKNPDIDIYIQSGTPIYTEGQKGKLNNENMDKYNARLVEFARANGCVYIDIASPLKDSSNGLAKKYTSDDYVHFTDAACELWYSILKDIAESK